MTKSGFKICSCGAEWISRDAFLSDPAIEIVGYQAHLTTLSAGMYMFNHLPPTGCGSTIAMPVTHFHDLYEGPLYDQSLFGTQACEGHCARIEDLDTCNAPCRNAHIRTIARLIRDWPKRSA